MTEQKEQDSKKILNIALEALDDLRAENVSTMLVEHITDMMEYIVIATATSRQHAVSLGKHLKEQAKHKSVEILGMEGLDNGEWILVDLGDVVVHIMLEATRTYYELEKLWDIPRLKANEG
ncbi:ribosome silencing factor [Thiotrichales bacterium 19X7-9]|nr:ribosome silencing factor [Thiotrichales bacterium 19X7-9]TNF70130.1 MAG: ribosome silencing factor [Gammaproteobacteria bacterium]UTW41828.1 ribosome silencing factor [bacterium SCSIO 12844]